MQESQIDGEARRRAFSHVAAYIDRGAGLPSQVFSRGWSVFRFFESDRLFLPDFAKIAAELLEIERAEVCCLVNFHETDRMDFESAAMLFIDGKTEPKTYDAMLRRNGPRGAWLYLVDHYGCASDRGQWSIYAEKDGDIAVIAFRHLDDLTKYAEPLQRLHAYPLMELIGPETPILVPFGQLLENWRRGLVENYAESGRSATPNA